MRRTYTQNIREVVDSLLKELKIDRKIKEVRAIRTWEDIVGRSAAKLTTDIKIYNSVMYVHLNSSVVRNELSMMKTAIIEAVNRKAGETIITDIVLR